MASILEKPRELFDRTREWGQLADFVAPGGPDSLRLGVVYGRRRQGKSEILQRLCQATDGFYTLALEQHAKPLALQRFADGLAEWAGMPTGLSFNSWENALDVAVNLAGQRANGQGRPQLIVIDELPFLLGASPELPGVLQWLYDKYGPTLGGGKPPVRIIVCGSALSVMSRLLSESKALYGRATVNLCLGSFDHIDTAEFWGIEDPEVALQLHAIVGGVPGYKAITAGLSVPPSPAELDEWLMATVFNPGHVMSDEIEVLFSQEPGIKDRSLYYGVLAAVAGGAGTPAKIAAKLERDPRTMTYPLGVLRRAGFIAQDEDILTARKPVVSIADPIMRFHHTITLPRLQLFQRPALAPQAWEDAKSTFSSQILGPHFEYLAREWTITSLGERSGVQVGWTGTTSVPCREHGISHQLDVVSLRPGDMPRTAAAQITLIGEAKCTNRQRNLADLSRLAHIRDLLGERADGAALALFSRSGFRDDLRAAADRGEAVLADLDDIYTR